MAAVAVYAAHRTRESVFGALYDRRVYATSGDRIILRFCADGHPMGSEYETDKPPVLELSAVGTSTIARAEIKKQCRVVHSVQPASKSIRCQWSDPDFASDQPSYYYARVVQDNGEEAVSSPIWVN
jgi:hypothetical protein